MSKKLALVLILISLVLAGAFAQGGSGEAGTPTPTFVDNGNGTITDASTGLMWEQAPVDTLMNWMEANEYAKGLSLAGYSDWRLPYRVELRDLVREERTDHAAWLNSRGFKNLLPADYLSGTYFDFGGLDYAWVVNLVHGGTRSQQQHIQSHVWFVRGVAR
jgi:hypothetical protein